MKKLLFLLGEKKPDYLSSGEDLLVNILDRLSLFYTAYSIEYCYESVPPTKKDERSRHRYRRLLQFIEDHKGQDIVIVGMGWMAIELFTGIAKTRAASQIGCWFPISPFKNYIWFTYDPSAALFDPNLAVDITATVSAAIRYAGRQIIINTNVQPYKWPNL